MRILCRGAGGRIVVFGPLFHVSSEACAQHPQINVSMDGRGRVKDNIWIERFWKTIKYEYISSINPDQILSMHRECCHDFS